jgi:hypothetical protein
LTSPSTFNAATAILKGGREFLWNYRFYGLTLNPEDRVRIYEEMFNLCYHGIGYTWDEVYSMPISIRYFNLRLLLRQKEKEKEASEKQPNTHTPMPKGPPTVSPRRNSK